MEVEDRPNRTLAEIIIQDCYTPEELATLLEMDVNLIREEAYQGRLRAVIVDHHIVGISRAEALHWLDARR
jgi:hypothetical protein